MWMDKFLVALTLLPQALFCTLYMVAASSCFATILGLPLGIILTTSHKGGIRPRPTLYFVLDCIVNMGRSFPFAILMVALIPFTRWLIGTSLGTTASIVPLTLAAAPLMAKLVENSLKEIEKPLVEAAIMMGSSTRQIIFKLLLPEALPSLICSFTLMVINLISYSAMAGLVGGGGLGQIAIQYGYQRFNTPVMISTVLLLIFLVQLVQWAGNYWSNTILAKRGRLS